MPSIINATTTGGVVVSGDNSGVLQLQNNGTNALTLSSSNFQFNSGYGSVATAFGCRAWVNFDGTTNTGGFCTIRGSGNVTSVADNGTGDYTVNFTTAMPDINYAVAGAARYNGTASPTGIRYLGIINANGATLSSDMSTTFVRIVVGYANGEPQDPSVATVIVVR
jgi:hypothetical protein